MILKYFWPLLLVAAGILEVGGDAAVRKGLRESGISAVIVGCVMLGSYALVVNSIQWDFGKLLGVYVAVFALVSVLWGRYIMKDVIAPATIVGVSIIIIGGLIISWSEVVLLIRRLLDLLR
jgi:small multidrug resistance family-3 protein